MNSGLRLLCCSISNYARSVRDVGLSFAHDIRVLHMIIRSLASPLVYSFSHFGSLTSGHARTHTCTHHTLVFDFALDIQRLCILGSGIAHKSNLLVFGFALDTRTPCTLFSGFTHKSHQPPSIRHSALAIDTCMGPSGTLGEWYSALPRRSEKKSAVATRNIGEHGLTNFNVKALVVRHEVAPATVPPHL